MGDFSNPYQGSNLHPLIGRRWTTMEIPQLLFFKIRPHVFLKCSRAIVAIVLHSSLSHLDMVETWLEPLFLSGMPLFSPFLPLPVQLFSKLSCSWGFPDHSDWVQYFLSVHSALCIGLPLPHNVIFLGVGRDWDCFPTCTLSAWHKAGV